jgi:hypothetical protein
MPRARAKVPDPSPKKRGRGRPRFEPSKAQREAVMTASGAGVADHYIALLILDRGSGLPISETTLKQHFRLELSQGRADAHLNVGKAILDQAKAGNMTAAIWYSKTQMGWRETQPIPAASADPNSAGSAADLLAQRLRDAARAIKLLEDLAPPEPELVHDAAREEGAG